jgi:FkbM family methyltransferase
MEDALRLLVARGYRPRVILDGGSNVGQWATLAGLVFPDAHIHLVEPQPACQAVLATAFAPPRFTLHRFALSTPGVTSVRMASVGGAGVGTGAFVTARVDFATDVDVVTAPASTLDDAFAEVVNRDDRALLKLDLEGHELEALSGGTRLLTLVEAIVCEVSFFDVYNEGHTLFADVLNFLRERDFVLYDFAALYPRARDQRLRMGDAIFVRTGSPLLADVSWD